MKRKYNLFFVIFMVDLIGLGILHICEVCVCEYMVFIFEGNQFIKGQGVFWMYRFGFLQHKDRTLHMTESVVES